MIERVDVTFVNEEVLVKLGKLPEAVQELVAERMLPVMEALRMKVVESVGAKFNKEYPEMFVAGVSRIGGTTIGYVEFQPSDKSYWIRVGSKGILANRETGFLSKHDVLHPAMTAASIMGPLHTAYETMQAVVVDQINEIVREVLAS